ncbi:hypothetical protein B0J12DRAFT_243900 [Macrophomina phaseolina]|uniref:Uncharacterized protein n=1 Tax=Macrophomina phaseolina TaxID=35725 RepID=A0ABQ8G332_9PEZI|nr:hypothetical protein B0J12DRAFT_243900 [Macrophomina phaseolina]
MRGQHIVHTPAGRQSYKRLTGGSVRTIALQTAPRSFARQIPRQPSSTLCGPGRLPTQMAASRGGHLRASWTPISLAYPCPLCPRPQYGEESVGVGLTPWCQSRGDRNSSWSKTVHCICRNTTAENSECLAMAAGPKRRPCLRRSRTWAGLQAFVGGEFLSRQHAGCCLGQPHGDKSEERTEPHRPPESRRPIPTSCTSAATLPLFLRAPLPLAHLPRATSRCV